MVKRQGVGRSWWHGRREKQKNLWSIGREGEGEQPWWAWEGLEPGTETSERTVARRAYNDYSSSLFILCEENCIRPQRINNSIIEVEGAELGLHQQLEFPIPIS